MALNITWVVEQMSCYPQYESEADVVFTVYWRCNGVETQTEKTYYATNYGSVGVAWKAGEPFTPYADLTQDQVIGWTKDALGEEQVRNIEVSIVTQIQNQINPPVVNPPLPWSNPAP